MRFAQGIYFYESMKKFFTRQLNEFFERMAAFKVVGLCYALSLVAIVCVGFSTWIIKAEDKSYTVYGGTFSVYSVSDSAEYIQFATGNDSLIGFEYYASGFTDGKGNFLSSGYLGKRMTIQSGKIQAFLEDNFKTEFALSLTDGLGDSLSAYPDVLQGVNVYISSAKDGDKGEALTAAYDESRNAVVATAAKGDFVSRGIIENNQTSENEAKEFYVWFEFTCKKTTGGKTEDTYGVLYDFLTDTQNGFRIDAIVYPDSAI